MMHEYHERLPRFDARQIFHDGCGECERRGGDVELALGHMDCSTFTRAWARAAQFSQSSAGLNVSAAEARTLRVLGLVQQHTLDASTPLTTCDADNDDASHMDVDFVVNEDLDGELIAIVEGVDVTWQRRGLSRSGWPVIRFTGSHDDLSEVRRRGGWDEDDHEIVT